MQDDPKWIDVTELMQRGNAGLGEFVAQLNPAAAPTPKLGDYVGRLSRLLGIVDIDLHIEEVTGADKSLDVVVKSSTTSTAAAQSSPRAIWRWPKSAPIGRSRDAMKKAIEGWTESGYHFNLDWLLRSVNTVLTGEAKFSFLHGKTAERGAGRPEPGYQAN